jgi:hypothetical protein
MRQGGRGYGALRIYDQAPVAIRIALIAPAPEADYRIGLPPVTATVAPEI